MKISAERRKVEGKKQIFLIEKYAINIRMILSERTYKAIVIGFFLALITSISYNIQDNITHLDLLPSNVTILSNTVPQNGSLNPSFQEINSSQGINITSPTSSSNSEYYASYGSPVSMTLGFNGNLYIVHHGSSSIEIVSPSTMRPVSTISFPYSSYPTFVCYNPSLDEVIVTLSGTNQIAIISPNNQVRFVNTGNSPIAVAYDPVNHDFIVANTGEPNGSFFINDFINSSIYIYNQNFQLLKVISYGFEAPQTIAVSSNGDVFVGFESEDFVSVLNPEFECIKIINSSNDVDQLIYDNYDNTIYGSNLNGCIITINPSSLTSSCIENPLVNISFVMYNYYEKLFSIAALPGNQIVETNEQNSQLVIFSSNNIEFETNVSHPLYVIYDNLNDHIYLTNENNEVIEMTHSGGFEEALNMSS
ncbi:YncE family protein [Sulfuracidifex tepidarius]|uniref:Virginiamycin B lyase n=1 Tax=Sulfuracidifex tepidarius TaxID=1294262 RepID=A0A510E0P3_9CREN|nr:hypothetical protein [Sulfuracidifex tepidarius]BBG26073.1 hypothetical protein IC007_0578 [Sulfuracidifex tepidarius]